MIFNVKFSQDLTHQKSLKSVYFRQSYSKNKKMDVFIGTQCRETVECRLRAFEGYQKLVTVNYFERRNGRYFA